MNILGMTLTLAHILYEYIDPKGRDGYKVLVTHQGKFYRPYL